jgi:DNA processing protein
MQDSDQGEEEIHALLQLRLAPGVGDLAADRLLQTFGTARSVLDQPPSAIQGVVGPAAARGMGKGRIEREREATAILARARDEGLVVVGRGSRGYPPAMERLADPPCVLFMQGRRELLRRNAVTVVGARRATAAGRRFATALGQDLSRHGVPVVSGLALGIDAAAHRGALEGPGFTVAVLASGVDRAHPSSHRRLQERIRATGLLVSEFLPGEAARRHHFPRRNRLLAALGRAVVVVEAGVHSGALITVEHALDLGADIHAVPGSVEYEQARGVNQLIRDGAAALAEPGDLIDQWKERGIPFPGGPRVRGGGQVAVADPLGLLSVLGPRPMTTGEVAARMGVEPRRILGALSELELEGVIVRELDGWRMRGTVRDRPPRMTRLSHRLKARSRGEGEA